VFSLLAIVLHECGTVRAAELPNNYQNYIVVKKGFIATNDPVLLNFAKQLGVKHILEQERNPICCIWIGPIEIDKRIAGEHFVMVNYGYTLIQVTSNKGLEMLSLEIKRRGFDEKRGLPQGVLTSFKPIEK
jgi:hypothetical protein